MSSTFAIIDGEYINLYDKEVNVMLHENDECFFLFNNIDDVHIPMIGRGIIVGDQFLDGLNKQYIIELQEVIERDYILDKYFYNKIVRLCTRTKSDGFTLGSGTLIRKAELKEVFKDKYLRVDAFFVRKTYQLIKEMKDEYVTIIRQNLKDDMDELDEMITNYM